MEPIHQAAYDGDVAAIDRLVAEDGARLDAQIRGYDVRVDDKQVSGCTPLMLAAWKGHDAAAARLLALGADVGLTDGNEYNLVHWACMGGGLRSVLALLIDAGAPLNACPAGGGTPLMQCVTAHGLRDRHSLGCIATLIDRGRDALDVNVQEEEGWTALHFAAHADEGCVEMVQLLLQAGADPTIRGHLEDETPLDTAGPNAPSIPLLEAALVEPQRTRAFFKARALLATRRTVMAAAAALASKGLPAVLHRSIIAMAVPSYLAGRVAQAQELPGVQVVESHGQASEELVAACLKYALGIEGGGGVVLFEGQEPAVGMLPEVCVELLELLVPKWDPARKGRPLGEGV